MTRKIHSVSHAAALKRVYYYTNSVHRVHRATRVGIRDGGRSPPRRDRNGSILRKYLNYEFYTRDKLAPQRRDEGKKRTWMKRGKEEKRESEMDDLGRLRISLKIRPPKIAPRQTTKRPLISVISSVIFI